MIGAVYASSTLILRTDENASPRNSLTLATNRHVNHLFYFFTGSTHRVSLVSFFSPSVSVFATGYLGLKNAVLLLGRAAVVYVASEAL